MIAARPRKTTVEITGKIHSMLPTDTYRKRYDMIDWTGDGGSGETRNQPENEHGTTDSK